MGFMDKMKKTAPPASAPQASAPSASPQAPPGSGMMTTKKVTQGETMLMKKSPGGVYTLITTWGKKDYDLYALVEYTDGHVEVVSCFGTTQHPHDFSNRTNDGAVVHVSGDKVAGGKDLPQEVIVARLKPNIKSIVPVVYSAKNSGTGSFYRYQVSTYVIPGEHQVVPTNHPDMIAVEAVNANRDDNVYTFVPAVIHNGRDGAKLEGVELYSRRNSERRPTVRNGQVSMDTGEENSNKPK